MTLPAPSPPDDAPDPDLPPTREVSSPAAFIAVVAVSALVVVLCVLGATMSGLFGFLSSSAPASSATDAATTVTPLGPSARTPSKSVGDGQWLVGADIIAGTFATTVPADSPGCTWERASSTDGTASSVLESGLGRDKERLVVTIKPTDVVFQTLGCGTWVRTGD